LPIHQASHVGWSALADTMLPAASREAERFLLKVKRRRS
jgi:hypothetical protein